MKKKLTKKEIDHLAVLSALKLSLEEIIKFSKQLTETIDYINNLKELDAEKAIPTYQTTSLINIYFDEDQIKNKRNLSLDEVFQNSKNKKNGYFVVKRIL